MKVFKSLILMLIVTSAGCSGNKTSTQNAESVSQKPVVAGTETASLMEYLKTNGDYVNGKEFPSLIKASIVNDELGKNNLVIDLRPSVEFDKGHIKGSVNKKFEELITYFESGIKPFEFEKIIIVSDDGQIASYTVSLLRLMGYGNVYAMRWGMSAWNEKYAQDGWLKGVTGKYEADLDVKDNLKPSPLGLPELKTGMTNGEEIASVRFKTLFLAGTGNVLIAAEEIFKDPDNFFIINLERKDKYDDGHLPGAVRYKPEATLGFIDEMATIPSGKTVVVYCGTGHNSGFATAYLRLFGYDARTLKYGNNGFMYDKMVKERSALSWLPFTKAEVNNFEVVK